MHIFSVIFGFGSNFEIEHVGNEKESSARVDVFRSWPTIGYESLRRSSRYELRSDGMRGICSHFEACKL